MDYKKEIEHLRNLLVVKECLVDYVEPILVFGNIDALLNEVNPTIISSTLPREEFAIINNVIPQWVKEVELKTNQKENLLIIKDIDKISVERQEILLEILDNNQISTESLPENLKIILHADKICDINPKIRDIVECYNV